MPELINWTNSPLVIQGSDGQRVTIPPGKSRHVEGDFSDHPWVKKSRLEIVKGKGSSAPETTALVDDLGLDGDSKVNDGKDGDTGQNVAAAELEKLRTQYQNITGKKAHHNASAATLRQKIDDWRNQS
ncbi:hypothetical protein FMK81_13285 [Klebsiella oxytoca]|uniref:hypothetical protein n=1 Tax=Klebsiella oxytoca TaxID=571 RepID=UPI001CCCADBE|nr:hypothetical protein [Klebsiella oxytoca]MBZ7262480.1 hypothetical protein [Klebsiella oxytoca]